ncbi:PREDICTED: probable ATP-dependent RNA helicase DDX28 [Dufourea novaeangliae]|uniref:probable ATP-dependent RNA helicase DDX28 n=1 Tax=Dufourea novaeangliae TaxID=178035 RepID=UPI0007670831|nr:PREDICTED: probable ATP-dependent RNA helicase DDX28 [Dufourea novaeangliae]
MLLRFCNLCCKSVDSSFVNVSRHYARAATSARRKEQLHVDATEAQNKKIPIILTRRKEYNFYKGQMYGKKEVIPLLTKGWSHRNSRGDHFFVYPYDNAVQNQTEKQYQFGTFNDFCLDPSIITQLENLNIKDPVEIQQMGIPKILEGHNTLLTAETGCGKTLAYLLPLINQIMEWKKIGQRNRNCPLGLIVTPTRELAVQIALELIKLSKCLGIKTKMITGGKLKRTILHPPVDNVDILVGSFGAISKLFTYGIYNRNFIRCLVLDEADALFHHTFEEKLKVFLNKLHIGYCQEFDENGFPKYVQLILASATVPSRLKNILSNIVNVDSVAIVQTEKLHKILVPQKFIRMGPSEKPVELLKYVKPKVANREPVIIFSNTSGTSYWLTLFLNECGINVTNLNGKMPLSIRMGKYGQFLNGHVMVLSTTNAGSRGLDTVTVNHILNYDFPVDTADYIHRCGRTGRIGTTGDCRVTNFICKQWEVALVQKIEKAVRKLKPIPIVNIADPNKELEMEDEVLGPEDYEEPIIEDVDDVDNIPY